VGRFRNWLLAEAKATAAALMVQGTAP